MKNIFQAFIVVMTLGLVQAAAGEVQQMSFSSEPTEYRQSAIDYIETRMSSSTDARYEFVGEPYEAKGVVRAGNGKMLEWSGYAQDVRVDAQLPSRGNGSAQTYTVVYAGDQPIALGEDFRRLYKE